MPKGQVGHPLGQGEGQVEPVLEDGVDGSPIDRRSRFLERERRASCRSRFHDFGDGRTHLRGVPVQLRRDRPRAAWRWRPSTTC